MFRSITRVARRLRSAPAFSLVALLTLTLGIGASTAIFSVVNGVLLKPLPFVDADRLVFFTRGGSEGDLSVPDAVDLRAQSTSFDGIAAFLPFTAFDVTGNGEPERASGAAVESEYFRALGMQPLVGRTLLPEDDVPGGERVVVLSEGFWQRRFGGDPSVVGRPIQLTGEPYTVVGVMPADFDYWRAGTDVWAPMAVAVPWTLEERGTNNLEAIGRLAPGASIEAASSEIAALTTRLAEAYPDTNQGKILEVVPLRERIIGGSKAVIWLIFAAVVVVLLIACVNVANLFLVRSTVREREVAVRMALGGSRLRVAASALGEAAVLAVAGGTLGALAAVWGTQSLLSIAPAGLPRVDEIRVDWMVLAFTLGVSGVATLLFGWVPALSDMRRDPAELLSRGGGRGSAGRDQRVLGGFVIAEVALAAVLLVGSGLLVRSFLSLRQLDLGYDPANVITANFVLPEARYSDRDVQDVTMERVVEALGASPGVKRAAFLLGAPMTGYGAIGSSIAFDDRPPPEPGRTPSARLRLVVGDYFETLDVPLLEGRRFSDADDREAEHVAIVNESFAEAFWPGESPIGKRVATLMTGTPSWMTVVGVAGDVEQNTVSGGDPTTIYLPYAQRDMPWARFGTLLARGPVDPGTLTRAVKAALWSVDPTVPFDQVAPLADLVDDSIAPQRFSATLVLLFAALALLIAMQGLYGVLAYTVALRRGEIGVRLALGASSSDVLGLVVRRGVGLVAIGLAVGLVGALVASRLMTGLLFGVTGWDPTTYAIVGASLLITALAASGIPALQAARFDPAHTLREE